MPITDKLNRGALELKPSGIRRFFDLAYTMENVISLGVGEPDFVTPWHIRDAGIYSLEKGNTQYTPNRGLPQLCDAIGSYLERRFNLHYESDEILVTVGGSEAIDLSLRALLEPGDEVIIPEPCFVCYDPITRLCGGVPVPVVTRVEDEFRLTVENLERVVTPRSKVLILPFPNNPTGAVMDREQLAPVAEFCVAHDLIVVSDEIYAELTYGGLTHTSISSLPGMRDRTIIVSGLSKSHAMTGWRIGYAAGPRDAIKLMMKIHQFAIMCAPTMSQNAALEALRTGDEDIEQMREEYDQRRRFICDGLNSMGLRCFEPKGAFYVFPDIRSTGLSSDEFCQRLLYEQRLAVIPGNAFGEAGEGFVRCSYAYSVQKITIALERMEAFLTSLRK